MPKPYFINMDVELMSNADLSTIALELRDSISILLNEKVESKYVLNFEINEPECDGNISKKIEYFLKLMNSLSKISIGLVTNCDRKVLDFGYNSGSEGWLYSGISNSQLHRIASLGFDLNISVYGIEPAKKG